MPDPLPGFTWDSRINRYRVLTPGYGQRPGTIVARAKVMEVLETKVAEGKEVLAKVTVAFNKGELTAKEFQVAATSQLKTLYVQQAALGAGGWDKLTQSDYGSIGQKLRGEYRHLSSFIHEMATTDPPLTDKQVAARARSYAGRARSEFIEQDVKNNIEQGKDEERRILGPTDHCDPCLSLAAMGWQPIDTLPNPGTVCLGGGACGCQKVFRVRPQGE